MICPANDGKASITISEFKKSVLDLLSKILDLKFITLIKDLSLSVKHTYQYSNNMRPSESAWIIRVEGQVPLKLDT